MGEKKLYLYMRDDDYGKKLQKYLTAKHHPKLRVEMMTEREVFWESRAYSDGKTSEVWLTDDRERISTDRGDARSLIILDEKSDTKHHRISYLQKSGNIYTELLTMMDLSDLRTSSDETKPLAGVYGVYSSDIKSDMAAGVLAQELGSYGACLYVSFSEFPIFFDEKNTDSEESRYLGELIFKLDYTPYKDVVDELKLAYGKAYRLPGVAHYRDVSDMAGEDISRFIGRLADECDIEYIVICFDRIESLLAGVKNSTRCIYVRDSSITDEVIYSEFKKYMEVEGATDIVSDMEVISMEDASEIKYLMERTEPENWLEDDKLRKQAERMWISEDRA